MRSIIFLAEMRIETGSSRYYPHYNPDGTLEVGKVGGDGELLVMSNAFAHVQTGTRSGDYDPKRLSLDDIQPGMRVQFRSGTDYWVTSTVTRVEEMEQLTA